MIRPFMEEELEEAARICEEEYYSGEDDDIQEAWKRCSRTVMNYARDLFIIEEMEKERKND